MKVLILAAGYAVRLKSLTLDKPKPLLEIAKRKIIDRIVEKVASLERADSIYVITNDHFFKHFLDWSKSSKYRDRISLVNDGSTSNETRLGAIRDVGVAVKERHIDDDLLVIAGDNLFDFDLSEFTSFASARPDGVSVALYDVKDQNAAKRFGVVKVDDEKKIVDFEEKPALPKSTLISTGIYYFPRGKIAFIARYIKESDKVDAPGYYISWLSKVDRVYGYTFSEDWYDIGDIESYKKADTEYSRKEN